MNKMHRQTIRRRKQHGSALLVSLMVMVGLSLLGLGFVAITQTENTISANERNYAQVLGVAEAGARVCVEWFQDPEWAWNRGLLPLNSNSIKTLRVLTNTPLVSPQGPYSGYYKSDDTTNTAFGYLFDKPFKPSARHRLLGDENHPDVIINTTNSATFLATFNSKILSDTSNGQVTEIRVFAPPIVNGILNANGFWEQGTRYGLATIKVTAQKFQGNTVIAQRSVKVVISEWPFPGPQGPVQSNANISTGGNFGVHWGKMTSELNMDIKSPWIGLPWFDAFDRVHFERGYYAAGQDSNNSPNDPSDICNAYDWLYRVTNKSFEDPWFEARAKGNILNTVAGALVQPFKIDSTADDILNTPDYAFSNWFQHQDSDISDVCGARNRKLVVFPKIDYEFWKNLSRSSTSTNSSVHYLSWVGGENYTDGVSVKNVAQWVNTARPVNPAKPGFYFFDTQNGLNPQGTGAPGILAPDIKINSSDDGSTFKAAGFVYLNCKTYGTQGIGGPDGFYNFPGEPFRDIGFRKVIPDPANPGNYILDATPTNPTLGEFDFQDLNGNGVCDIFLEQRTVTDPGPPGATYNNQWLPKQWFPGCTPGFNGVGSANCSEPHEPFLNLVYPATAATSSGGPPTPVVAKWEPPNNVTKRSKAIDESTGSPYPCPNTMVAPTPPYTGPNVPYQKCTSNGYDRDGSLVNNFRPTGGNAQAILDGVLYNEGGFDSSGNGAYFGSVLINGPIGGTGTAEVWFDELLIKGGWQDKFKDLPRVFITAHETDQ